LGIGGGIATRVRFDGQHALAKAGWIAASLWIIGMGARMGFQLWSDHGGQSAITHFSAAHDITSSDAWVTAFVLMALTEVTIRVGTIVLRAHLARQAGTAAAPMMHSAPIASLV
jgi:hypothetical protein